MRIKLDLRLLNALIELEMLDEYLDLIEAHIRASTKEAADESRAQSYNLDRVDWHILNQRLDWRVEFVLSRVLRNSFLVTLFAVYETIVTEVANLVQKKTGVATSLSDISTPRAFTKRAKRYYKKEIRFDLSTCNERWKRIRLLSYLRNAIVHRNGRIDMVESRIDQILSTPGVDDMLGFITVSESLLRDTYGLVKADLDDLITRYKEWDANQPV
ncbi:MAG: hypothetical protein F4X74_02595 [Acidimicrobiia bacterium]|nr:hypothetical protein [Acidimicrobiia bacterium]